MNLLIRATLESVKMKSGEWKMVFNVPQTETEMISVMVNTCQDKLLKVNISPEGTVILGKEAE